jgi:hypothetical protein
MINRTGIALRRIVNHFLSANIVLATDEQAAAIAKSDLPSQSGPFGEIGRILHDMLIVEEEIIARWDRRIQPIFQWSPSGGRNKEPDFTWLAERVDRRFERSLPRKMAVLRPTEMLEQIRKHPRPLFDIGSEEQVFRSLALTDAFLNWDESELHDDDGLSWILLPNLDHQAFGDCPAPQPDVALDDVFDETLVAIIVGDGQSRDQLWAMHEFLADREIAYQYW